MIEIIKGQWAAGEVKTFHIGGEYLEILEAQYPCDVYLMDKSGAQLSIMRSSEASFFSRPREGFQTVQITSAQAQQIRVFVGSGDAGTRRISSTVSVIDGARARTMAGVSFLVGVDVAAAATFSSCAQFKNPAGSGKNVVISKVTISSDAVATAVGFGYRVAPLLTLAVGAVQSKVLGVGAGSSSVIAYRDNTFAGVPVGAMPVGTINVAAGGTFTLDFPEPMIIPPDQSFIFWTGANNVTLRTIAHVTEEAI